MSSPFTRMLTLLALTALIMEGWQFYQTKMLEDELAEAGKSKAVHAASKPAPVKTEEPPPEFAGEAAEPGKPLTLADGSVVTVNDSTPRSVTVHRPANTGTLLAKIGDEVRQISVDDIKNNPDLMKQLTGAAKYSAQREFANYLKQSGLTSEQQTQFQTIMADRTSQIWLAALQVATSGNLTMDKLTALNQQVSAIEQTANANLRSLYPSDDDFAAMQAYQTQNFAQGVLSNLGPLANVSLSPEQSNAISGIIQEEYAKAQMPDPLVVDILWGSNSDMIPVRDGFQQMQTNIQNGIAAVLTPEQSSQLNSNPTIGMQIKSALMRPNYDFDSATAFSGGNSASAVKFKFFPGERSGMGGGGAFGYTQGSLNGTSHNKDYVEVDMQTD